MKKYLLLLLIPLTILACKPVASSSGDAGKIDTSFANPPGTIHWTASGGRANKDFRGTFDRWKLNSFNVPKGSYAKVKAEIAIDIESVNVDPEGLENHLRADDYLDAKGHPTAIIAIDGAAPSRKNGYSWETTDATMSLNGETKNVSLYFNVKESMPVQIQGIATVLRKNHKVGDMESESVKNNVEIEFNFTAPK